MGLSIVRVISLTNKKAKVLFTDDIDPNVTSSNISIEPPFDNVESPTVRSVEVEDDVVTINFSPLFPLLQYKFSFISTSSQSFQTVNGESISEIGNRNILFLTSPGPDDSPVRDNMLDALSTVYENDQPTNIRNVFESLSDKIQESANATSTVRSANYVTVSVEDEAVTRGSGPTDTLSNGGVYEITRVGLTPSRANLSGSIDLDEDKLNSFETDDDTIVNNIISSLPDEPVSLQSIAVINESVSSSVDAANFFDGLVIDVANSPVTQLISVTLVRDGTSIPYNINQFGYSLNSNRYDTVNGSINVNLANNQIELSSAAITGGSGAFVQPKPGDTLKVSYIYKKLGRDIDTDTVQLSTVNRVVREQVPASATSFSLKNAPIVLSTDNIPETGGVTFLNTQPTDTSLAFTTTHPAFRTEIKFSSTNVPNAPGQYAVNYNTGQVLVFGEDINNLGTGSTPPVATYYTRKIFTRDTDYTVNEDRNELVAKSTRNIDGTEVTIRFDYEDTFAEGQDYNALSHIEVLGERVENRLINEFEVETENFPLTNVFRVFNETTGEIYNIQRIKDSSVIFSGRQAPVQLETERERVRFVRIPQEVLLINDEFTNSSGFRVLKINLENSGITDSQRRFVGANFDTSITFSDTDIFSGEKFYEDRLFDSVTQNINRLTSIGEYSVDYNNGIIYVAVASDQGTDLGDISYEYKSIQTKNDHILRVNDIYRSSSVLESNSATYSPGDTTDDTINVLGLEQSGQRFINDNASRPLLVGTYQSGEDGVTTEGSDIFTASGALFTSNDIGRTLRVGSSGSPPVEETTITGIISDTQVTVDSDFNDSGAGRVWVVLDTSSSADKKITLDNDIVSIQNIYIVNQLGSRIASELDGYFDLARDSFEDNVITLGSSNPLEPGDAVIVVYNYGDVFVDYRYLRDNLLVSYEYGDNAIDWSISNVLNTDDEYFVSYKFGALREPLLTNFGSLTQIPTLTNFPPDLDREVYRSIVHGTLQSFIEGPTIPSIKRLGEAFTDVEPEITETVFNRWILGTSNLHLRPVTSSSDPNYDVGRFGDGLALTRGTSNTVEVPAVSNLRLNEGTWESWIIPQWDGKENDATLTFDLERDGYKDTSKIYIGVDAVNPDTIPFSLNTFDSDISVFGEPTNLEDDVGYFIWFDESSKQWNIRWRDRREDIHKYGEIGHTYVGSITSDGEVFNINFPTDADGYSLKETHDVITSRTRSIEFSAFIDCREGPGGIGSIDGGLFTDTDFVCLIDGGTFNTTYYIGLVDGGFFTDTEFTEESPDFSSDGITFESGDWHYIMDMAASENANRLALYKDGTGYINFEVYDNQATYSDNVGRYNISHYVGDWAAGEAHHVAASWKFNTHNEQDEMHLFIDGAEVPNIFKYGGNPVANSNFDFGDVAETTIDTPSVPVVGAFDGSSEAGSDIFSSQSIDFGSAGVTVGDTLYILEENADGTESGSGGAYTITGVGGNTIQIGSALTLTLGDIHFSVNQITKTVNTPVNFQDFILVARDSDGSETELKGLDATEPDYSVTQNSAGDHILKVQNGVEAGQSVILKTLGLVFRRCKARFYSYSAGTDTLRFMGPAPVSLDDVDVTAILMPRFTIDPDIYGLVSSSTGGKLISTVKTVFTAANDDFCQPTNNSRGRKLKVLVSGENIDFDESGNEITINGTAYSGATSETLTFTSGGTKTTSEFWLTIDSINISLVPVDKSEIVGAVEIKERKPLNVSENNGDRAEIVDFDNGIIKMEIYGTGGDPFPLDSCTYEIDYPSFLRIRIDDQPDNILIGSDFLGNSRLDGVLDEVRSLKKLSTDTRIGEELEFGTRSITTDFNASDQFEADNDTLLLLHLSDNLDDSADFIDSFNEGFVSAPSVNSEFGTSILFEDNKPFEINNAAATINNDAGTIEFWVSPLDDTTGDPNYHYYIDAGGFRTSELESSTRINVILPKRASEIKSVRLLTDEDNVGTNYFTGGSLSSEDNKTITLGTPLPVQNVAVKVSYVPIDFKGDRLSVFRDDSGFVNFFLRANEAEHLISVKVNWKRHTWHKIMAMWRTNSVSGEDRIRLFVDGEERGTIKYGTGLIYGTGIIWGQAEVRSGVDRFVVDNIDLTDTLSRIFIGTDVDGANGSRARIDNIRFSEIERLSSIKNINGVPTDLTYNSNTDLAIPLVSDVYTTRLIDFDNEVVEVTLLTDLVNESRGIFRFEIDVIDSFDKVIGNQRLEDLLDNLINTVKPAHTEAVIRLLE